MAFDPARAKSLFLAASDLADSVARAAYLDNACGDDNALRQRVEALLIAHDEGAAPEDFEPTSAETLKATAAFDAETPLPSELTNREHRSDGGDSTVADTPRFARSAGFVAGQVIAGRYKLLGVLGEGGMGTVYRADQTAPVKRQVALKVIKIGMDSRAVLARFDAERQALALMDHPNIARVYDGGTTEVGQPFFVMELVSGEPITDYCDRRRLPVRARLELFVSVCQAVQHAHQKGIIHRDLKPSNVMVTEVDGRATPKIIDFGVAKATESALTDHTLGDTGSIVGTPTYMSPEQADPSSMDIDTRTDVYALGVILYELLAGSPPIDAKQFKRGAILEMLRMVREVDPPKPSTKVSTADALPSIAASRDVEPANLKRTLRGDLDWIVMKALEKDRRRRYETVNGFAADLLRHLAYEPVVAAPPSRAYRLRKFVRKYRGAVIAASLVLLSLLGGLTAVAVVRTVANTRLSASLARETSANTSLALANGKLVESRAAVQEQLTRAQWLLYAGKLAQAQNDFEAGNGGLALHYLDECQVSLRGWEYRYLWTRINARQTLVGHHASVWSVAYSRDGRRIVTGSGDQTAKVWDAQSGQELRALKGHADEVHGVAFSPDGQRIVTGSLDRTAKLWDVATGQELLTLKGHTVPVMSVAFSPDGRRIGTSAGWWGNNLSDVGETKVWDVATGRELFALKGHSHRVFSGEFSPDGKRILTASDDATAKVWDAATGKEILTLKGHPSALLCASYSPDGKRIVTGSQDNTVRVWDAATGQELLALKGHNDWVWSVAFSPDSQRIVSGSYDLSVKVWDARTGKELRVIKGHSGFVRGVVFSPDGGRILTSSDDNTAKVWDAEKGQEVPTYESGPIFGVAYSPDGKRVVSAGGDTTAKVWDTATRRELFTLKGHTETVWSVAFSPDGQRIVSGSRDRTARVWDAATGRELLVIKGPTAEVYSVAFSPDGKRVLTGAGKWPSPDPGEAKVWDATTGQELLALKGKTPGVSGVAISPDGKRIVTGCVEGTVKVWDAATGQELHNLKGHTRVVWSVAFSPDGKRIVTAGDDQIVRVWDAENGQEQLVLKGHTDKVRSVAFSPDGKRIVTGGDDKTVKLWDAEKGQEVLAIKHDGRVWSAVFSPDGRHIAAGGPDSKVNVLSADRGQEVLVLKGHTDGVTSVAFSPDGQRIFAWDTQKKLLAWSVAEGKTIDPVNPPSAPPPGPAISPDGSRHASPEGKTIAVTNSRPLAKDNAWSLPDPATRN